jgi:hypothetical protein
MAEIKPKLPATLCDPCEVPKVNPFLEPRKFRIVTTNHSCFSSMIKNMTAAKACAVWPAACDTE